MAERLKAHQVTAYLAAIALGVAVGLAAPGADRTFEALIYPTLGALLYATFLQVPFTGLRAAFGDYVAFLVVMAPVGRLVARGFDAPAGRALVFTGATRNSLVVLPRAR